jgi:hypothetical protein
MDTGTAHTKFLLVLGAAFVSAAAPVVLFLSAGTAQAVADVSERGAVALIDDLPTPRECSTCGMFDPQADPPGFPDPGSRVGIGNPNDLPPVRGFHPQPDPPDTSMVDTVP